MIEQQLASLLAREAIRDLPLRYCDCVWRDDIDGIIDLFADGGSFTALYAGKESVIAGHDDLREFYVTSAPLMPRPYIHNHVIELHDDKSASGRCYLDLRSAKNNMGWIGAGYYNDEYILTADGWKFQARLFNALHMEDLPASWSDI
ncbi:MAG TPA: hypothetical protein DGR97_00920 [Gammaproteobacteria bacterium]|nr:hypothetical protein [Gammaproteobacteria bacterium]|tara:strand:+ start:231 stop:671 length:441 start_codon:yes stop_codon:yes gene_type:complete